MAVVWLSAPVAFFGWGHPEVTRGSRHHYRVQKTRGLSLIWLTLKPKGRERGM